jgi:hypothetical protein
VFAIQDSASLYRVRFRDLYALRAALKREQEIFFFVIAALACCSHCLSRNEIGFVAERFHELVGLRRDTLTILFEKAEH